MNVSSKLLSFGVLMLAAVFVLSSCQTRKRGKRVKNKQAAVTKNSYAAAEVKPPTPPPPPTNRPLGRQNAYSKVTTGAPIIALTYDDGPHPTNTPRLLDILRSRQVRATFYVTGENSRKYPEILRRMVREGHEIGNHTITHSRLTKLSQSQIRHEIVGTTQAIKSATGMLPRSFRPPYGATNDQLKGWIKAEFGMPSILWSVDPEDWKKPGVGVVTSRLVNGAQRGGILLLHDIHSASVDATPATVDQLKSRGYQFVTISQLIGQEQ